MNRYLILSAIEEVKKTRQEILMYLIRIGHERTARMTEVIGSINAIEQFETAAGELYDLSMTIPKSYQSTVSGQPEQK